MRFHRTRTTPIVFIAVTLSVLIPALAGTNPSNHSLPRATQEVASWTPLPPLLRHLVPSPAPTITVPPSTTTTTTVRVIAPRVSSPPATLPTPPTATTTAPPDSSSDDLLAEWTRVAVCEEGGWIGYAGPEYPDSLGINAQNWYANGGGSDLSPAAQIAVGQAVAARYVYAGYVPDQHGCASW